MSKLIQLVLGFRSSNVDDAVVIKDMKRLESFCVAFNILPNGFAQDASVTPSKWTIVKSIIYFCIIFANIGHLVLLSVFNLPDQWLHIFGDFFCGHPGRRFFWLFWLYMSIFGEVLRHFWIYLVKKGHLKTLRLYDTLYTKGFRSQVLLMSPFYCLKFRFVANNLAIWWIKVIALLTISLAPILVFISESVSQLPKTPQQFIYTYCWLFVTYLGLVCALINLMLTGGLVTIHLAYFYFKAVHVAENVERFARKRRSSHKVDYLLMYKATIREVIQYQNEIEHLNVRFRNWLIFLYLGMSFTSDFGVYIAAVVHIDHNYLDVFLAIVALNGFISIGICSYVNGIVLTKMSSYCKNLRKGTCRLQLDPNVSIKETDIQDRLVRTDIAFTIGQFLDMTTEIFVIYLIENISLIMMFTVNFQ
uniref:Gustatory receptor n=1 Tax=Tetranychus urticae TaxID=32264 RepID=T1KPE4_TETUR